MLFNKKIDEALATATIVEAPIPEAVETTVTKSEFDEYLEKAEELGVVNGAMKEEILRRVLKEEGITRYDYGKVGNYLDSKFGKPDTTYDDAKWCWRPLRKEDAETDLFLSDISRFKQNGQIINGNTYQKAVPMPVLLTVEKIAKAVPDVYFYVSDETEASDFTDPFLMITAIGMSPFVIEKWDEPGFRG